MFEHKSEQIVSRSFFLLRLFKFVGIVFLVIAASLFLGMLGYHRIEHLSWLDSLLDSSMILTGMGPVHEMKTDLGKLFASCYALFSGVVFLSMVAVLMCPLFHRILHTFHIEVEESD